MRYSGSDLIENIRDMLINHEPEVLEEVYNELATEEVEHVGDDEFKVVNSTKSSNNDHD